ncbi:MAG: 3-methyl-2-oxobutanoate hydroxymethyltransferase [Candidatus Ancillula sp.]|jgi:3-methyl-2-oxobutanoate hydroxymethyltransferase|nr:3-methyl-2-oxobutanoate hydroxymethyltransferase [Candidatus Ancillula sp.]
MVKATIKNLMAKKGTDQRITMVTCYDSTMARIVEESEVDSILIGDSLGNTMMGYDTTLPVTVDDIIHHCASVTRICKDTFVVADMPFGSYHESPEQAVHNATRLIKEGGAQAVKLEGGAEFADVIRAIVRAQIPVVAHLGLTPQSVNVFGGYKVQGKQIESARKLIKDAEAVQEAGASMLTLEGVPAKIATIITEKLQIPTIGIGAGVNCDGQVLVIQDLLGMNGEQVAKFVKLFAHLKEEMLNALNTYSSEVNLGTFPTDKESYKVDDEVIEALKSSSVGF